MTKNLVQTREDNYYGAGEKGDSEKYLSDATVNRLKFQILAERRRKVERIKQQLAKGNYKVEGQALARAILHGRTSFDRHDREDEN